ncbi:MAG: hypothetical protein GXP55_25725, partial [Deltaproteobacteria bacterium]|nr:hypothetical protein [Deltaproteobacteria bacterium]
MPHARRSSMNRLALALALVFCDAGAMRPPDARAQVVPEDPPTVTPVELFDPAVVVPRGALAQTHAALEAGDAQRARSVAAAAAALTTDPVELA